MIFNLLRKKPDPAVVTRLYHSLVAAARQPVFYAEWGVPDTVSGRFDMISLHAVLLFRRLRAEGAEAAELSQAVFDLFFKDMDRSLREMGVGDLSVPKKIRKMGEVFYGLLAHANAALDKNDEAEFRAVLGRNLFEGTEPEGLDRISAYFLRQDRVLAALGMDAIRRGELTLEPA